MTVVYSNNFDSETTGAIATSFANKVGTWQVTTGTPVSGAKSFGSNSNADGDVVLLTGVTAMADMQWDSKQKVSVPGSAFPLIGHVLRSDSSNANHYLALFSSMTSTGGNVIFFKKVSGSYSVLTTVGISLAQANGDVIYVRSKIVGSTISVYVGNGSLPGTVTASVTDSSITAAGYAGFYNAKDGVSLSMTIDDVALDDLTAGSVVSGNFDLADMVHSGAFAVGALSQLAGGITMDDFLHSGTLGLAPGRIDTAPFKNWSGTLLSGATIPNVVFLKLDRTLPLALVNQVTAGDGVMTIQNAALVTGTYYIMVSYDAAGANIGAELVLAT